MAASSRWLVILFWNILRLFSKAASFHSKPGFVWPVSLAGHYRSDH